MSKGPRILSGRSFEEGLEWQNRANSGQGGHGCCACSYAPGESLRESLLDFLVKTVNTVQWLCCDYGRKPAILKAELFCYAFDRLTIKWLLLEIADDY